jgi:hypothetical protein
LRADPTSGSCRAARRPRRANRERGRLKGSKKPCKRATPAVSRIAGRGRGDHLMHLRVLERTSTTAARGPAPARISCARSSDPTCPARTPAERTPTRASFAMQNMPMNPTHPWQRGPHQDGDKVTDLQHTRLSCLRRPVGVALTTTASAPPSCAFPRNPRPSDASMCWLADLAEDEILYRGSMSPRIHRGTSRPSIASYAAL